MNVRLSLAAGATAILLAVVPAGAAIAQHGADDGPRHHSGGDDRTASAARHGNDDGPRHHRHGNDDGPRHHRHGNDGGPRHHRHGNDDGPGHK